MREKCPHRRVIAAAMDRFTSRCIDCGARFEGIPGVARISGWMGDLAFHFNNRVVEPFRIHPPLYRWEEE